MQTDWTYELLEINCINNTPDLYNWNWHLKRVARGHFVIDGDITVGKDLTDDTIVYAELFYSPFGQHFFRTPFHIPNVTLSDFYNKFYKDLCLDSLSECATNQPLKDKSDVFVAPLTKRIMKFENCVFSTENLPSHMKSGYYKANIAFTNEVDTVIQTLIKVEYN